MNHSLRLSYDPKADWVHVSTESWSGSAISIKPSHQDFIPTPAVPIDALESTLDLDKAPGWHTVISPHGTFAISAPMSTPLIGWTLEFWGFSRLCERLRTDQIDALFGPIVSQQLELLCAEAGIHRESPGDQLVTSQKHTPVTTKDAQEIIGKSMRSEHPMPRLTQKSSQHVRLFSTTPRTIAVYTSCHAAC